MDADGTNYPGTHLIETLKRVRPEEVLTIQQQFESAARPPKPTMLQMRILGASASVRSSPHDTAGDAGVDLGVLEQWSADSITGPGETPLRTSLASLVGRDIMLRRGLRVSMKVVALLMHNCPAQRSPGWYLQRLGFITASESAAVLGDNKYQTSDELLQFKIKDLSIPDNHAMAHGRGYEDECLELFVEMTKIPCFGLGLITDPASGLGASVDAITYDGRIVEIKCPMNRWIRKGLIPKAYRPQMQQQAFVVEAQAGIKNSEVFFVEYKPPCLGEPTLSVQLMKVDDAWYASHKPTLDTFLKKLRRGRGKQDAKRL